MAQDAANRPLREILAEWPRNRIDHPNSGGRLSPKNEGWLTYGSGPHTMNRTFAFARCEEKNLCFQDER